jgi:hypothetical protein
MKRNILVALLLSLTLFSCRPKVIYVDRPVNNPPANNNPAPASGDNQLYQPPAGAAYTGSQQNNNQQYNNNGGQQYDNGQQNNSDQQQYSSNQINNQQESDQQYYANQQQVNYGQPSYQTFYDELSPYGSWVNYQGYGYVWSPAQGTGFMPYATNGYWGYSDYGMTWVSNYNWGWAPFHYGRWIDDPFYGWLWIPGNTWAPAWVTWGQYNGYYGWAPVGPSTYAEGYRPAANYWTFVPQNHMYDRDFSSYAMNHYNNNAFVTGTVNNVVIINNTNTYNNASYNAGPKREVIETAIGHKVQPMAISDINKPTAPGHSVMGNSITLYRPAISQATAANATPSHVVPIENVRAVNGAAVHGVFPRANNSGTPASHQPVNSNEKPYEPAPNHPSQPARPAVEEHTQPQPTHTNNQNQNQNQPRPQPKPKPQSQPKPPAKPGQPQREKK